MNDEVCIVKFQTIVREHREIVVGRIKVPTVSRAYRKRRKGKADINSLAILTPSSCVDMTPMPFRSLQCTRLLSPERRKMRRSARWTGYVYLKSIVLTLQVRSSFDTRNMNGGRDCDAVRLAGQWVSRHLAIYVAPAYKLTDLITVSSTQLECTRQ